jgi:hypothetical protein
MRPLVAACAVLLCGAIAGTASAQDLPRLHITALGMHADRATVAPGDTYHVTIHVHVAERRDRLDELQLPTLTNATDLGDERRRVAAPGGGTDFYEIMTVSSPDPGSATFTPAYIDAIDPATGRGMRYSSQPLSVTVTGGATAPGAIDRVTREVRGLVRDLVAVVLAVVAFAVLVAIVRRRRRRPPAAAPPPAPVRAAAAPPPPADALRAAVDAFRASGDDASLDALRGVLFTLAGARPGATLTDALQTLGGADPPLARAMAIAERVRFGPQSQRATAARDLFAALDALAADPVRA